MFEQKAIRSTIWFIGAVLLMASAALAQVQVGENTTLHMDGTFGFGYSGGFGETGTSSHGLNMVGNGNITGDYYNKNFISFSVQPYFNRSQSNGTSQSVFNEKGANTTFNFFGGSRFPGSVTFAKSFNSLGQTAYAGVSGLTSSGSQQSFGINWGVLLPDLPTLQITYSANNTTSTLLGDSSNLSNHWKNLNLYSTYQWWGFQLNGFFNHQNSNMDFPNSLGLSNSGNGSSNSYGLNAAHKIPLSGTFGVSYSHTANSSETSSGTNQTDSNNVNVSTTIAPVSKLTVSSTAMYTGNLLGSYLQNFGPGAERYVQADNESRQLSVNTDRKSVV